jgi:hypothetical protein
MTRSKTQWSPWRYLDESFSDMRGDRSTGPCVVRSYFHVSLVQVMMLCSLVVSELDLSNLIDVVAILVHIMGARLNFLS